MATHRGIDMRDQLIGIDWGITSFRAYLMTRAGEVRDTVVKEAGILHVPDGDFDRVLVESVGPWLAQASDTPAIASGMIGSRQGWVEAPYVSCPAGVAELAAKLVPVSTRLGATLWLVPGIMHVEEDGTPDVARGEETQIIGSLDGEDTGEHLYVLPGTHTKWALVRAGRIIWFATFMTGEVFALLCEHSILGRLMEGDRDDSQAFRRGLALAARKTPAGGGLLRRLFSVRTLGLFGELPSTALRSYLSGLLIGSEIAEAKGVAGARLDHSFGPVRVVGSTGLAALYADALRSFGFRCHALAEEVAAPGLARIAAVARIDAETR